MKSHSVALEKGRCVGCTACIKSCPTQAIRVKKRMAFITEARCIDCGECIRVCPKYAKIANTMDLEAIREYRYPVALVSPALYGQFPLGTDSSLVLSGLIEMGFKRVVDVAQGADYLESVINGYVEDHPDIRPLISAGCPAVSRLIAVRFPELAENVIPVFSPAEIMAKLTREKMIKEGYPAKEVGIFYLAPCTAEVTAARNPIGMDERVIDGSISIGDVFWPLFNIVKGLKVPVVSSHFSAKGLRWASIGGEAKMLKSHYSTLAVDGLGSLIEVLESLSMGRLQGIDYIEGRACTCGCVGGVLNVENSYVAREIIRQTSRRIKPEMEMEEGALRWQDYQWNHSLQYQAALLLDEKPEVAMLKLEAVNDILRKLPGMDCGACGAPNCRALAEDIVQDQADQMDCIFVFRDRVTSLAEDMVKLSRKLPLSMSEDI